MVVSFGFYRPEGMLAGLSADANVWMPADGFDLGMVRL